MAISVRILLVDGTTSGIRTAEIGLSTVKAVLAPRGLVGELSKRIESSRSGVYVLVGEDPQSPGRSAIYVGEGDEVITRIRAHIADEAKDFFDRVLVFVGEGQQLNKAHIRYLEARLVSIAKENKC
jgi:hypothetical protein